jgi:hypothetical protein
MLFLGDDLLVRRFVGYSPEVVTPPQVAYQFSTYSTVSDAIAFAFHMEGQVFYTITFPSAKKTWQYNLASGFWNEILHPVSGTSGTHGQTMTGTVQTAMCILTIKTLWATLATARFTNWI